MFDLVDWDTLDSDVELVAGESDQTDTDTLLSDVSQERHVLPADLESIPPGNFLAAIMSAVDSSLLSGYDLVRYVQAQQRLVSHYQAGFYQGVAELAHATDPDTTARGVLNEFASEELQAALAKTRRAADADLDLALDLRSRIPQVWEALREGRIDVRRARIFARETVTLDPDLIPQVVEPLLENAAELTTGQLGARLAKRVIEADPTAAEDEYQAGLEDRKMVVYPNPDHTADLLLANITPQDAVEISNDLHSHALALKRLPGETRTLQQVMADLAVDRLKGSDTKGNPVQPKLVVHIKPGEPTAHVPGYGPILASSLRHLAETAESLTLITDADGDASSRSITAECHLTTSRQPTKTQVEHVRQQYRTCIFMGCRMPAERCDIDHRHPHHKGGRTICINLAPLCRHHHVCKTRTLWNLERNPDGSHTWTSPLGHTYTTRAPP
jgi:hypothetical protein